MSALRNPKRQAFVFFILVTILYLFLARPVEKVTDYVKLGDRIYLTAGPAGLRVLDATPQGKLNRLGAFLTGSDAVAVAVKPWPQGGQVFAYVAEAKNGLKVIDVTDPARLSQVDEASAGDAALDLAIWEDYLYVATGKSGVKVFKLLPSGKLETIKDAGLKGDVSLLKVLGERLYLLDDETLRVYSLKAQPTKPLPLGGYDTHKTVHDLDVVDGPQSQQVYLAANWDGVQELKVSKPVTFTASVTISPTLNLQTSGQAYGVSHFDEYIFVADGKKGVQLFDLTAPKDPVKIYDTWGLTTKIWFDDQTSQVYVGDGYSGLRQLDFMVGLNARLEASAPGSEANGMDYVPPYFYVAAGGRGLRVLVPSPNDGLMEIAFYDTPGTANAVQVNPKKWQAFVADRGQFISLGLADLYHPAQWPAPLPPVPQITPMSAIQAGPSAELLDVHLAPDGMLAYLAAGAGGLWVVDIHDPLAMTVLGKEALPGAGLRLDLDQQGKYALVASGAPGLNLIDLKSSHLPTLLDTLPLARGEQAGEALGVAAASLGGNAYAYVAAGDAGLCVVPVLSPLRLGASTCVAASGKAVDVVVNPGRSEAYVTTASDILDRYDLKDPAHPVWMGQYKLDLPSRRLSLLEDRVVVSVGKAGLRLLRPDQPPFKPLEYDFAARANQFVARGSYLYAVNGPGKTGVAAHLGLSIIDVSQPAGAREVGFFASVPDTNGGAAYSVALHPTASLAYLADGANGLKVLNVSDPQRPALVSTILLGLDARHFWVDPDYPNTAYLAFGTGHLGLVDLKDPFHPGLIASVDACNQTPAVWVQSYLQDYALVACQGKGIASVVRVGNQLELSGQMIQAPVSGPFRVDYSTLLATTQVKKLLALDVSRPARLESLDKFDTSLLGQVHLAFPFPHFILALHDQGKMDAFYQTDLNHLDLAGSFPPGPGVDPLDTTFLLVEPLTTTLTASTPPGYAVYAANSTGMDFYKVSKDPRLVQLALYETPGTASHLEVFNALALRTNDRLQRWSKTLKANGLGGPASALTWFREAVGKRVKTLVEKLGTKWPETGISPKAEKTWRNVFWFDFVLFGLGGIFLWAMLFAQFALPVQGLRQRWQAALRLVAYLWGSHGTMAKIHDGIISHPEDDPLWKGPGVVLVDVTSAAVLEKRVLDRSLLLQALSKLLQNTDPTPAAPYGLDQSWLQALRRKFRERVLPLASAAEMPPPRSLEQVVGPGLVFTSGNGRFANPKWDEVVLKAVDLRKQVRTTAEEVHAVTQEGIEVKNRVFSIFSVSEPPDVWLVTYEDGLHTPDKLRVVMRDSQPVNGMTGKLALTIKSLQDDLDDADKQEIHNCITAWQQDGLLDQGRFSEQALQEYARSAQPPFYVDPDRVMAAAVSQADKHGQDKPLEWYELPERVAVKLYRNLLAQQPYDGLYRPNDPQDFPLKQMKNRFVQLMRAQGVLAFQYIERIDRHAEKTPLISGQKVAETSLRASPIQVLTNSKVLRDRGIKLVWAGFTEMRAVNEGVNNRFIENWRARWEKHADLTRTDYQLLGMRIRTQARARAQVDMIRSLREIFDCGEQSKEVLALRVFQALESAAADPLTRQLLPSETIAMLQVLRQWLTDDVRVGGD